MRKLVWLMALLALLAVPALADNVFTENFAGGFAGGGWTVVNNSGTGSWVDNNPGARGPFTNLSAPFAIADSDINSSAVFDTDLISPTIDCTGYIGTTLSFGSIFVKWATDHGTVAVSNDNGGTWTQIAEFTSGDADSVKLYDIAAIADDESEVKIKFHYDTGGSTFQYFWAVDNVSVDGYGTGADLIPDTADGMGNPLSTVTYTMTVVNNSGADLELDVALTGNVWDTTAPATVSAPDGALTTFDVEVTIPGDAGNGDTDAVTVTVSDEKFTDASTLTTTATFDWSLIGTSLLEVMDHAVVSDGVNLYRVGGFDFSGVGTATIEKYSDSKGTWEYLSEAPHAMVYTVAAAVLDGKIYAIAGGIDADMSPSANTFMVYDIAADTWDDALAEAPGDGTWGAALLAYGGKIYKLGGGGDPGESSDTLFSYDPAADEWTELAAMDDDREFFCAWVYGDSFYVTGGIKAPSTVLDSGEIYDVATDTWAEDEESLPAPRWAMACPAAGPLGNLQVVAAGVDDTFALVTNSYYRDVAAKGEWLELGQMATPVYRTAGAGLTPTAYVVGGSLGGFYPSNGVQTVRVPGAPDPGTYCVIDGAVYDVEATNPENVCEKCDPATSDVAWSPNDGASCDDGAFCNGEDTCSAGECVSAGDPCAETEECNEDTDECVPLSDDDTTDDDTTDDDSGDDDDDDNDDDGCGC
jgi:hypothetical protein